MLPRARLFLALVVLVVVVACSQTKVDPPSVAPRVNAPAAKLRFAAVGDIGDGSANSASVAAAIATSHAAEPIDLLLLLGDLIYPAGDPGQYQSKFAEPYRRVLTAGIEIRAVLGNHDLETDPEGIMNAFGMPSRFYSFNRDGVQFFALDSSREMIDEPQRMWFERELAESNAGSKVILIHHPMYSSGIHGSALAVRGGLEDLLVRHGTQLVLAAHDHNYERTNPISGIVHVVVGTGCCVRPGPLVSNSFTASFRAGLGFLIGEVNSSQISIRWVDVEGNILDSSTIQLKAMGRAA